MQASRRISSSLLAGLRVPYESPQHSATIPVHEDPMQQFKEWLQMAVDAGTKSAVAKAMTLATATASGIPSARMVIMVDADEKGFQFYSHEGSQKGKEMAENDSAALVFYWEAIHRQVRVEGNVVRLPDSEADDFFRTRPRGFQIAVSVSKQSEELDDMSQLEERVADMSAREREGGADMSTEAAIARPKGWGGYCVVPREIEFWQGSSTRMHQRLLYVRQEGGQGWRTSALYP